jgi:PhnB protein
MLTVRSAAAAVEFYRQAFRAVEGQRFTAPAGQVVAEMMIGSDRFFVVDENPDAFNLSPETLGGTSVRVSLLVEDADTTAARAIEPVRPRSSRSPISRTG